MYLIAMYQTRSLSNNPSATSASIVPVSSAWNKTTALLRITAWNQSPDDGTNDRWLIARHLTGAVQSHGLIGRSRAAVT